MANYSFSALTANGKTKTGTIEADSREVALQTLRQQKLLPMQIDLQYQTEKTSLKSAKQLFNRGPRLSNKQLVLVTQQLATLISSSLPVDEALQVLQDQSRDRTLNKVLTIMLHHVNDGQSLGVAMSKASSSFTPAYTATIAAGENNGQLGPVLQRLADYSKRMQQTKSKIQIAMIYPSIIITVSIAVVVLLMLYVVPQVSEVITSMNQTLPTLTLVMINISKFIQQWGAVLLLVLLLTMLMISFLMRVSAIRMQVHRLLLRIPIIGRLLKAYMAGRFCKSLALIYSSGQPVEEALHTASKVVSNDYMRQHIEAASQQIQEGDGFLKAFKGRPILPLIALHLIASGQNNGQLANMLDRASDDLEQTLENSIATTLALLEPLMMLVMGAVVLLIVMAVMVPILDMNQLVM